MRFAPFAAVLILFTGSATAQNQVDSIISRLQEKNLVVLGNQLALLSSHPVRQRIEPDPKLQNEAFVKIAGKAIEKSNSFRPEARLIVLAHLSEVMVREGNVVPGYALATQAIKLSEIVKGQSLAYAYSKYSDILNRLNFMDSSLFYSEKMLDLAHELHNDSIERLALDRLSMQCYRIRNYPKSEFFLKQLIVHPVISERNRMDYFNTIALTFRNRKMFDSANYWFNLSLEKAVELKDTSWLGLVHGNIGFNNYLAGKMETAKADLLIDLKYSFHTQSYRSGIAALGTIVSICLDEKDMTQTKFYYDSLAASMWRLPTDADMQMDFLRISTDFYEKSGDPRRALHFARRGARYKDSIEHIRDVNKASDLEAQFDFNRQLQKIESLEQKTKVQETANKWKNYLLLGTSIFILLGVGFIYVLQRSNKFKFQTNQILQEQNIKISQQADNLNELNATKDKLLSIISHDLRGPVNSLKALMGMATKKIISPEEFSHFLGQLEKNVENVNFTLDNVLYWSRSQLSGIQTRPVAVGMAELVDETFNLFSEPVISKGISVSNLITSELKVFADPDQIRLVLRNLISNAIKFTGTAGKITISSTAKNDQEIVQVHDTGMGMSAQLAATLFTSSAGITTAGTIGEKGTGLGLSLCREMIERNQGRIWVESEEGVGTSFFFSLIRTS